MRDLVEKKENFRKLSLLLQWHTQRIPFHFATLFDEINLDVSAFLHTLNTKFRKLMELFYPNAFQI